MNAERSPDEIALKAAAQRGERELLGSGETVVLELYRQACLNSRALMELRFKHFATFMVLTGLLGALIFRSTAMDAERPAGGAMAVLLTALFWLLDYRTYHLFLKEELKVLAYERALNRGSKLIVPTAPPTKYRASFVTNMIFLSLCLGWIYVCCLCEPPVQAAQRPAAPSLQSTPAKKGPWTLGLHLRSRADQRFFTSASHKMRHLRAMLDETVLMRQVVRS